ncbi:uncharacterized protein PGTG_12503 [Puccinia graminis f. sp. tritici CRL 75-36-700-3]|uniref:Uncharacterized protein n=1 Tax=Puccinia graminis f. sp. tritici (strain CRL 75-36-700-3 / race SCCL) TaxID=418459 RepID=E3KUV6_PUCGT|nr:uncharacterized protein PGTG_12503 [Puccinia graminis f. sp. tritici CRL 75-36-700-3]EFP88056.1 hypothetical protein PGTG_12503 [Puccinia graminis f. sp. tritici CRL 75-36-700-3]
MVSGRLGDPCPSYAWWRGLLTRNADAQGLTTKSASALAPFVLPELATLDTFLDLIESHFSSSTEEEDAQKVEIVRTWVPLQVPPHFPFVASVCHAPDGLVQR